MQPPSKGHSMFNGSIVRRVTIYFFHDWVNTDSPSRGLPMARCTRFTSQDLHQAAVAAAVAADADDADAAAFAANGSSGSGGAGGAQSHGDADAAVT